MRARTIIATVAVFLAAATPASAKWIIGNGPTDLEINRDCGAQSLVAHSLIGRAGLGTWNDPAVTPVPPGPYAHEILYYFWAPQTVTTSLSTWRFAGGRLWSGAVKRSLSIQPRAILDLGAPTPLNPPEPDGGPDRRWAYAAAPFNVTIYGGFTFGDPYLIVLGQYEGSLNGKVSGTILPCLFTATAAGR